MIGWLRLFSTRLHQEVPGFDEIIDVNVSDFEQSGLKTPRVLRVARLAVVSDEMLLGCIGTIGEERLSRIQDKLVNWIRSAG
jgi:mRNA interferase MazF